MKKILFFFPLTAMMFLGCSTRSTSLPESRVFINNSNFSQIESLKTGEACERYFLFVFKFGNKLTSKQAAYNGGITNIKYQETSHTAFWPLYSSYCIKVYGE